MPAGARRFRRLAGDWPLALVLTVLLLPAGPVAHAETVSVLAVAGSIGEVISNIQNWVLGFLVGLATLFLTVGGARYIAAGGDPGQVEKAKTAFRSAAFGYCLAAASPLVMSILK